MYDLGDVVPLSIEVRAKPVPPATVGDLANAGTMTLTVTAPDGTVDGPTTISPSPTGTYTYDYSTTQAGLHSFRWLGTGANAASHSDVFVVASQALLPLVSLADARAHLDMSTTTTDEELRRFLLSASDLAERWTGRTLRRQSFTETFDGGRSVHLLSHLPVLSITSVTESGTALSAGDYTVDAASGLLWRGSTTSGATWATGRQNVTVTYAAGYAEPPPAAYELVLEITRRLWETQRGASADLGGDEYPAAGTMRLMTFRIQTLIDSLSAPGFA